MAQVFVPAVRWPSRRILGPGSAGTKSPSQTRRRRGIALQFGPQGSTILGVTPHEVDVSWQALRQIVHDWAGSAAELDEVTPLAGGCINTTLCLQTKDGQKAVLKITPHRVDHAYADESHQLGVLRDVGIPVPDIYACKTGSL